MGNASLVAPRLAEKRSKHDGRPQGSVVPRQEVQGRARRGVPELPGEAPQVLSVQVVQ